MKTITGAKSIVPLASNTKEQLFLYMDISPVCKKIWDLRILAVEHGKLVDIKGSL